MELEADCVEAPSMGEQLALPWIPEVDMSEEVGNSSRGVIFVTTYLSPISCHFSVNHIGPSFTKWVLTRMWWTLAILAECDIYISSPTLTSMLKTEYIVAFFLSFLQAIMCRVAFTLEVGNGSSRIPVAIASNEFVVIKHGERSDLRNFSALVHDRPES
jgi:hypothetical protein